ITHDMAVVAETARRVSVMYAGQQVEEREVERLFAAPRHPYTSALLDALPERSAGSAREAAGPRAPVRLSVRPDRAEAPTAPGSAPSVGCSPDRRVSPCGIPFGGRASFHRRLPCALAGTPVPVPGGTWRPPTRASPRRRRAA
ncbi:MAG: hypothetical protein IH789_12595, partial [Acidobacteria bacterium]|nr:hypothetical protein [Acidobacteriota bacterium]